MQSRGTLTKGDLPKKTFPYVLMQAFKNSNMTENIKSGFRSTGLVPYNPSAIRKDKFLEATVDEEEDQCREETANEDNNPTEAEAFTKGWKEAQLDCLHRFEAIMSPDLIKLYKERLMHDVGSREYETLYYAWRELTQTPPCPNNPFSNFINSASPNHQSQDNPEEANRDEPFREPPIVSEVENTPVRTRPPPEESSPVAGPSHLPPIQAAAASVTAPSILGVELSESHSAKRRVLSSPPEHFEESPFKKYLRTPPLMQGKQAKRGKGRDKYPRALTALSFIEHLEKKEEAKRIAEQEKENRKKVREEKRLEKEKEKNKKKKKAQRREESSGSEVSYHSDESDSLDEMPSDIENDHNMCGKCKKRSGASQQWIGCEECPQWYHKTCVSVALTLSDKEIEDLAFVCDKH